jgi:MerR family transcriptional regulator/heat shock protein HspR
MAIHDRGEPVYTIGVMARLVGCSAQALRDWERDGLVAPHRTDSGNRLYSDEDYERLVRIQELTRRGINRAGVRAILELEGALERSAGKVGEKQWQRS